MKNANAAAEQWRKFGIDASAGPTEAFNTLVLNGEFDVSTQWPAAEPWGAGVDLSRTFDPGIHVFSLNWRTSSTWTVAPDGAIRFRRNH